MEEVTILSSREVEQSKADFDISIATAKQYPRDLAVVLNKIETYATIDQETAEECFYVLPRGNKSVEGMSVRFAEIVASAWGNLRVQTHIIGDDGHVITCQGICHDLESNLAVSVEVKRRITDKYGKRFNDDMVVMTGNAGSAIALRNAVLKVVPKALTKKIVSRIKDIAVGKSNDLETSRQRMIGYYSKIGVTEVQLLEYLNKTTIQEIDAQAIFELRGIANAIAEGTTNKEDVFKVHEVKKDLASEIKKESKTSKIDEAMKKAIDPKV